LRLLGGYALAVILPVLYLTQSRSGWIGACVGLSVAAFIVAWRRSRKAFFIMLVVIPLVVALLAGLLWAASPMVRERISGASLSSPDGAVEARLMMWGDTIPLIRTNPVWGYGPGCFRWVYPQFKSRDLQFLFRYTHNEYLQTIAEFGLIGLTLMAVFVGWSVIRLLVLVRKVSRNKDAHLIAALLGCLAASLAHAFFDFNLHVFSNNHFLVMIAGITMAGLYAAGDLRERRMTGVPGYFLWGSAAAITLMFALITVQVFFSYGFHLLGEWDREELKLPQAEQRFRYAMRFDRSNWSPYLGMGHIYQTKSFWNFDDREKQEQARNALVWYEQAQKRNSYDMEVMFGLAKIYNAMGDKEKALEMLRRAVKYEPRHLFYAKHLGLQLRRMGRYQEALEVFQDANRRWNSEMIDINIKYLKKKLAKQKK